LHPSGAIVFLRQIRCGRLAKEIPVQTAVAKWGNSLAIRLPRNIVAELQLHEGTPVELRAEDGRLVVKPARPRYRLADLLAQANAGNLHDEVDWGVPQGEENW
jgi:antitoxin MazE